MRRPIPRDNLIYAVSDTKMIAMLFEKFKARGYLYDQLEQDSMRYVSIWRDGQPGKGDRFRAHPLLPLGIMDFHGDAATRVCTSCERALPESGFASGGARQCFVCRAVTHRG